VFCFTRFQVPTFRLWDLSYIYRSDDALQNTKLVSPSINCDWFTCRHFCGLQLWKTTQTSFWCFHDTPKRSCVYEFMLERLKDSQNNRIHERFYFHFHFSDNAVYLKNTQRFKIHYKSKPRCQIGLRPRFWKLVNTCKKFSSANCAWYWNNSCCVEMIRAFLQEIFPISNISAKCIVATVYPFCIFSPE